MMDGSIEPPLFFWTFNSHLYRTRSPVSPERIHALTNSARTQAAINCAAAAVIASVQFKWWIFVIYMS